MNKRFVTEIVIEYNDKNVRIINSYLINDKKLMKHILQEFLDETGYVSKRSLRSWIKEWKSHTRLYRLGLFRTHTIDCDLQQNEALYRLIAYEILGLF